jgi:hypothetical protein
MVDTSSASNSHWAAHAARHGPGWSVYADPTTGSPSLIVGPAIPTGMKLTADATAIARARAFLEEMREILGVEDPAAFALERCIAVPNAHGQEIVTVNLKQQYRGIEIWHQAPDGAVEHLAMVKFQFNGTLGKLTLFGSDAVRGLTVPEEIVLTESEATTRVLQSLGATLSTLERVAARTYVSVRGERRFLAREVEVVTTLPPHDWKFIFDAHTGLLEERRDDLRYADVIGNVSAGCRNFPVGPGTPGSTFSVRPCSALTVTQSVPVGGSDTTDGLGNFSIAFAGAGAVTVTGGFLGLWANVNDTAPGVDLIFTTAGTAGLPIPIVMNPVDVEEESAEAAGYIHTNRTHDMIAARIPGFPNPQPGGLPLPVNVNIAAGTCNAFWNGTSINFYHSNGVPPAGCNNATSEEVVAHELGHGFHFWFHGSTAPGGFSEGIGDHLGLYLSRQRVMGRNFYHTGAAVRDYRPGMPADVGPQWPCTGCEVHLAGQMWGSTTMEIRDRLIARYGPLGELWAHVITIAQYASNPANEVAAVAGVFVQDDFDGDLTNGTVNCTDIIAAACRHGIPIPPQIQGSCDSEIAWGGTELRPPVVEAVFNSASNDQSPTLSSTNLQLWFASNRPGGLGGTDVYTSTRASVSAAWTAPVTVPALNSASNEDYLSVSDSGVEMFIASNRPGGLGGNDLWVSTGGPVAWVAPVAVAALNSASSEDDPTISADRLEIIFVSARAPSIGGSALWRSTRTSTAAAWTAPTRIAELDLAAQEHSPVLHSDNLTLTYASTRPGGVGSSDHYIARRADRGQPWVVERNLAEANSTFWDHNGDRTADGFTFYFSRIPAGNSEIFRADRILPALNGPRTGTVALPITLSLRRDPGNTMYIVRAVSPIPPTALGGVSGFLLIDTATVIGLVTGAANANGVFSWAGANAGLAAGAEVFFQGLSIDGGGAFYLSNRLCYLQLP